ncbi:NHL domain-containing protein [Candidatus Nitrospira bockiana]
MVSLQPGFIVTVAGNGEPRYAGDGGPAALAGLNEPKSVIVDPRGYLYIADSENHVVRQVDMGSGIITTVAGFSTAQADETAGHDRVDSDDLDDDPLGGPAELMRPYTQVKDLSGTVRFMVGAPTRVVRFAGDGGPATKALLNFPSGLAVDESGALYIADMMNHRVRKVDVQTGIITTIAGTGQHRFGGDGGPAVAAALHDPTALVCDGPRLFIADQSNHRVRCVDLVTGIITTLAGTGEAAYSGDGVPAAESALSGPSGLAVGPDRALYIADTFNGRIRRVDLQTGIISTVAGDGTTYHFQGAPTEFSTSLSRPYGIAFDRDGHLLITDSDNHLIRRWHRQKKIITRVAGAGQAGYAGDGALPLAASLNYPFGIAVDPSGRIFIADTFNHRIRAIGSA